ncbi:MAG TPA: 50S ribosomal protein L11 methyltransferase [Pyrinomonadaceae bacterium]|nr:50S ribosomal protein L11 methyltransferase [Pyrinomonadaceae bacterium]
MSDTLRWFAAEITASAEASEAIEFAFNSLEALGTEINHLRKKDSEKVHVVGYFNERLDDERVQDEVLYALKSYNLSNEAVEQIVWSEVENADWLHEWKKHWKASEVGRFVIAPPWENVDGDGKILIKIEPNMAFGTGTHETTQLCLKAIEENYVAHNSFLDVGTGTGILAIAAAKLAVDDVKIFACDTDLDSVKLAKENAAMNGVGARIEFANGPLPADSPPYDFVCANLTIDVILPMLSLLLSKRRKTLVLSGILAEQQPQIEVALANEGVGQFDVRSAGEWIAVVI